MGRDTGGMFGCSGGHGGMRVYVVKGAQCPKCGKSEDVLIWSRELHTRSEVGTSSQMIRVSMCCFVDEERIIRVTGCPDGCLMVGIEK